MDSWLRKTQWNISTKIGSDFLFVFIEKNYSPYPKFIAIQAIYTFWDILYLVGVFISTENTGLSTTLSM